MHLDILIGVFLYEILTILGVSWWISKKEEQKAENSASEDFVLAGKGMGVISFASTLALTILGAAHIWGATENGWYFGAVGVWFGIGGMATVCVVTQFTGPIVRKLGVGTMPELMGKLFGDQLQTVIACITGALITGFVILETRCIGVTISAFTGWSIEFASLVGGTLGILYVVFFGMKEIAKLNVINAVVMYAGLVITAIAFNSSLPGGWEGTATALAENSPLQEGILSIVGDMELVQSFAFTSVITFVAFHGISQMGLQPAMSAKDSKTVKKGIWLAAPLNGLFCVIPVCIGMAATTVPKYQEMGSMMAPAVMIVEMLPPWVVILIMAAFLGALLSTFAMASLCPATIYAKDLYRKLYKPNATDKEEVQVMRVVIVAVGILGIVCSGLDPMISSIITWIFSFGIPIFLMIFIGLFWKRSQKAAAITLAVTWGVSVLCTMTPFMEVVGIQMESTYLVLGVALLCGFGLTSALPGEVGYMRRGKTEVSQV